jgi:protein-tyrosine kinase
MSLIENALKKLQGARPAESARSRPPSEGGSAVPVARKKKITVTGPKYHVDQTALIKAGLLAPLDHAIPVADEFRRIKRPLLANAASPDPKTDRNVNVIMITSALPKTGKTFCSVNLAVSMSLERELNVLLVDADVAKPHISRVLGLADAPGLIDLLVDDTRSIDDLLVRTDLNDITVLPAGRSHPQATELLASDRMSSILDELATRYSDRVVLLDSPPLLITSESQALASQVGQITLVVEAGRTSHQELLQTLEALGAEKAVSIILNKSRNWGRAGDYSGDYGFASYGND